MDLHLEYSHHDDIKAQIAHYVAMKRRAYSPSGKTGAEARCRSAIQHVLDGLAEDIRKITLTKVDG